MYKKVIKNFLMFFSWSFLMSILLYLYQILTSRFLNIWDYWNLTSLISYYTIICIPISALGVFVTKYLSTYYEEWNFLKIEIFKKMIYSNLISFFWMYYLIVFFILLLLSKLINISFLEIILLIITSFIWLYFSFNQSINYSIKNMKIYSFIWVIDIILRIWFWMIFIFLWFWYLGAFLWFIIWNIFANFINIYINSKKTNYINNIDQENLDLNYKELKSFIIPTVAFTSFWIIINNIDIIIARLYLDWENLWYYSSIIIISRILIFWLSIFSSFIIPYLANYKKYHKIIISSYMFIILSWILSIFIFYFFPSYIINILFWEKYLVISDLLFYWSIIWFIYVLMNLIINHFILLWVKKYSFIWYIFIFILMLIIYCFSPNNFEYFIKLVMYSYLVSLLLLIFIILYDFFKNNLDKWLGKYNFFLKNNNK